MNRLVLIDGNAILHRAYHALPPLNSPDGTLVNAVYGFTTMLLRIIIDLAPTHVAVAFDRPKPTFRKDMFAGYQAKRPKMDDELAGQIGTVHDVVTALGLPIYELDGYEADDVIGTIVRKATHDNNGFDSVIVVTGDRDILQLVTDRVFGYMPTKGLSEAKLYGVAETAERMGVPPEKIPDFKALAGDPSDNYPGVAGIGPKTAADLIAAFGSVEALYRAIDAGDTATVSESVMRKLREGRESAMLGKDLATIRTDAPIPVDIDGMRVGKLATPNAVALFTKLGFRSLVKRLGVADAKANDQPADPPKTEAADSGEQLSLV